MKTSRNKSRRWKAHGMNAMYVSLGTRRSRVRVFGFQADDSFEPSAERCVCASGTALALG